MSTSTHDDGTPTDPQAGAGTAYRWDAISDAQVPALADLVNHLAEVDGTEEFYREEDLREELTHDGFDPERDAVTVWDGEQMVGFVNVWVPRTGDNDGHGRGYLSGGVREGHRGQGLGRALMDRIEPRAAELVAERHAGTPSYLRAGGGLEGSSASRMLQHRGYRVVRYYNELVRPLETVEVPDTGDVRLVPPGEEHEEAVRLAHNDAFRDHWGSGPMAAGTWHDNWTARSARRAASTVALSPTGEVLAYVMCSEWVDRELYVDILGTVREARGRGLAKAALLDTIDRAARSGDYDTIELGVDSQNPSGATKLYEQVGFVHKLQTHSLQRDLPL